MTEGLGGVTAACGMILVLELAGAGIEVLSGSVGENRASVLLSPEKLHEAMVLLHDRLILPQFEA